ncbi:MAG TPA: RHS repeat-associated core domain-containing protein [Streptosporangiaceae bacterium]
MVEPVPRPAPRPRGELETLGRPKTDEFPDDPRGVDHSYTDGTEAAVGGGTAPPGLLKATLSPRGASTTYEYTAAGDLAKVTDPAGKVTTYAYDALGRRTGQTETSDSVPQGVTTTYTYDGQSRPAVVTAPGVRNEVTGVTHTARTSYGYDADGNVLTRTVSDSTGGDADRVTTSTYDAHGQLETLTDPEGGQETYGYDTTGAVTSLTDAGGAHYVFGYTPRGQLATRTLKAWTGNPDHPSAARDVVLDSYAYDPGERLASHTDAMGRTLAYAYYGDDLLATVTAKNARRNGSASGTDVVVEAREYDGAGNLTASTAGDGAVRTEYDYDQAGQLVGTELDPAGLGRRADLQLDADNNVVKITRTGADGDRTEVTDLAYDAADRVISRTVDNGDTDLTTTYARDQRGLVVGVVDPRGNLPGADPAAYRTTMRYDAAGQLVETDQPAVSVERGGAPGTSARPVSRYGYDAAWERTQAVDPEGRTVTTSYDRAGRPVSVRQPSYTPPGGTAVTPTATLAYDAAGRLRQLTDARNHATAFAYDALGDLVHADDPQLAAENAPGRWSYDYDLDGEQLAAVDPTGARTEATYDDLGRQITDTAVERYPGPAAAYTTKLAYDAAGNLTSRTTPANDTTSYGVNAAGQVTGQTDPLGKTTTVDYDLAGRIVKVTDPLGDATAAEYDLAGRQTAAADDDATGAELRRRRFGYDAAGNPTSETTPEGHTSTRTYDAANRMTSLLEPVSASENILTTFGYDAAGERTRVTDGRNNATVTTYNTLGLPESVIEPATTAYPGAADRTWTRSYDGAGNPVRDAEPGGVTVTRTFDELDRLTKQTGTGAEAATADQTYGYDLAGRRTRFSAPGGDIVTTYDDRGLPLNVSGGPTSLTAQFGYDADGRLASRTDAAGSATFTWNGADELTGTTDTLTALGTTFTYDDAGNPAHSYYGYDGAQRDYRYDALDRQTSDTLVSPAGATLASTTYAYDKDDHLKTKTTTGTAGAGQNSYGYDDAGRLVSWTPPSGTTVSYGWDAAGNRTQAGAATYSYDERNRLASGGGTTYTYTARGTLASQTTSGTTKTPQFDAFDHLITDGPVSYAYDALDRVATRTESTNTRKFVYSSAGNDPVAFTDASGTVQSTYLRDPAGALLAVSEDGWSMWAINNTHNDAATSIWTNGTTVLGSTDYDPFGNVTAHSGAQPAFGYQGEYTDPTTGRVDMHARWYTPTTATFTSRDTIDQAPDPSISANRYTYADADPLTNTDPTGHSTCNGGAQLAGFFPGGGGNCLGGIIGGIAGSIGQIIGGIIGGGVSVGHGSITAPRRSHSSGGAASGGSGGGSRSSGRGGSGVRRPAGPTPAQIQAALAHAAAIKPAPRPPTKPGITQQQLNKIRDRVESRIKPVIAIEGPIDAPAFTPVDETPRPTQASPDCSSTPGVTSFSFAFTMCGTVDFIEQNAPTIAALVTGAVVGGVCGAAIGWTGVGAVVCGAASGAAGSAVHDLIQGGHSTQDILRDAGIGAAFGGLTGGLGAAGSQALKTGATTLARDGFGEAGDILGGRANAFCAANSFVAGTRVLMADGTSKPIEDVKVGDSVKATDPTTGKTANRAVTATIVGTGSKHLVAITIATIPGSLANDANHGDRIGAQGKATARAGRIAAASTITATDGHPFWVDNLHRWVAAKDLKPGYRLETADHRDATVTATRTWTQYRSVYNLTTDTTHTYYVIVGNTPILVHNCPFGPSPAHVAATADVSSTSDRAIFWSGLHVDEANAIAHSMGGETLESLITARGIAMPEFIRGNAAIEESWGMVSARYAAQASGRVRVILGPGAHPNTVWNLLERPTLEANPAVTQIDAYDLSSRTWSTIFRR